jgi:hypothetical protein
MSRSTLLVGASLSLLLGCTQHSQAWDDARAQCEGEALDQMEVADPDADQRATWRENYIAQCMDRKGFKEDVDLMQ